MINVSFDAIKTDSQCTENKITIMDILVMT